MSYSIKRPREKRIDLLPEDLQFLINELAKDCEQIVKDERVNDERMERMINNELLTWTKDYFQHVIPNTTLIDQSESVDFLQEPFDRIEPVDDKLYTELCTVESEVEKYIEKLTEQRQRIPQVLAPLIRQAISHNDRLTDESQEPSLNESKEEDIDVVSTYQKAIETLTRIEKSLPEQYKKYQTLHSLLDDLN